MADCKARRGAAVIVAHHFSAFAGCGTVYQMENGQMRLLVPEDRALLSGPGTAQGTAGEVPVRVVPGPPGASQSSGPASARTAPVRLVKAAPRGEPPADGGSENDA